MTLQQEIAALRERIAKAQAERDTWRTSGMQEKYLEAYSLVEALELQLARLRDTGLRSFAMNDAPSPPARAVEEPDAAQHRLMAALDITFQDGVYHLGACRYDRLADAVNYARLQQRASER